MKAVPESSSHLLLEGADAGFKGVNPGLNFVK